jgi:hypothetical protein
VPRSHAVRALLTTAAALAAFTACQVQAAAIAPDAAWNTFDVDPMSATSAGFEWIALDGSAISFDLALAGPAQLKVIDGGFAGDRFEVFDNGVSLGLTSAGAGSYPSSIGLDFSAAWADSAYSRGVFSLGAGLHRITGVLVDSALDDTGARMDATVGALSISPVPEPTTPALMLAGLAGLALVARRRACN